MSQYATLRKSTLEIPADSEISIRLVGNTPGYDGHCLRAFTYFGSQMEGIDPDSVESINSIKEKYGHLRDTSKGPTFLLTYQGTYIGMMAKFGFSEAAAKSIEHQYHDLYKVSDEWVQDRLKEAAKCGYVTVAFGLRVRTPLLHQTVQGTSATPYEAEAEGRTAGNALGQSYCLLNSRASVEFLRKARAHPQFRTLIRPSAHIHDAQYFMIPDDLSVVHFMNEHLVKAVQWQELAEIQHETVKLGGELSIFHPSWAHEIELPNNATPEEILDTVRDKLEKRKAA